VDSEELAALLWETTGALFFRRRLFSVAIVFIAGEKKRRWKISLIDYN